MGSKIFLSAATLVLTLAIAVGIIEMKVRWEERSYFKEMQKKYKDRELCLRASANPNLVYEMVPNQCENNSIGQRDVEHEQTKPKGTFRIGVIGDSVTEGLGVTQAESYPRVLEKLLSDSGKQVEVLKFAVRGYTTTQEIELLKQALKYDLDLIVWSYVLNDPAHPVYHTVNAEAGRFFYKPESYFLHWLKRKLFFADQRARSKVCPEEYHAKIHCQYWDRVQENFRTIAEISDNLNVMMLIHPVFEKDGFKEYELAELHEKLATEARSNGFECIDILEDYQLRADENFARSEPSSDWFDPWHPNAEGHKVVAERLAKEINSIIPQQ